MNFCVFLSTPVEIRAKYGYIGQREKVIFLQKEVRAKSKKKKLSDSHFHMTRFHMMVLNLSPGVTKNMTDQSNPEYTL